MAFRTDFAPYLVRLSMSDFLKLYFYDTGLAANLLDIGRATGHCTQSRSNRPPRTEQAPSRIWRISRRSWEWTQTIGSSSMAAANPSPTRHGKVLDFDSLEALIS